MPDTGEPSLRVVRGPRPFYLRRRFLRPFAPAALVAVAGLLALTTSANLLLPLQPLTVINGSVGSKADYFEDDQVRDLLLRHHIRVNITRQGSREGAGSDLDTLDFVFPSGQPAARLVVEKRIAEGKRQTVHRPFVSPVVLATYREYADTLVANNLATAQPTAGGEPPYYYNVSMAPFLERMRAGETWNDLRLGDRGLSNDNVALVNTTDVCVSNGAATYLSLVAYLHRHGVPKDLADATDLGNEIKPLLRAQGQPIVSPELYFVDEGRRNAPIIVIYEHQYLAHQLRHRARQGQLDRDRVLLYPDVALPSEPQFIGLTESGTRLGKLLTTDPDLRRRAMELGFRVFDPTGETASPQLSRFLAESRVPEPARGGIETKVLLPDLPLLEKMIEVVGDCPKPGK
ncbi:hypothetical protein Acsp05_54610 [Actinokineospora sp. NBRC 105648]|nr:hypothetical protein Acsp05_54610 [Actinokineospora sp. NBRC 105648]